MDPEYVNALLGRFNLTDNDELGSKIIPVWDFVLHSDWKFEEEKFDADIAIVVLTETVDLSRQIHPVCLPHASNLQDVQGRGVIVGWGKSQVGVDHDETPSKLEMPAISGSYCYTRFPKLAFTSSHRAFCAGFENQDRGPCTGDSGGGFFTQDSKVWLIRGIISSSLWDPKYGCDVNVFGIYTNVAIFRDWIGIEARKAAKIDWKVFEVQCKNLQW